MRILLVEDEESKRDQVTEWLTTEIVGVEVVQARSLNSGLRALVSSGFDLVILDMTMPTFDIGAEEEGGRPQAYGGRELLRNIRRRGLTVPVIVLTQFDRFGKAGDQRSVDELDAELKRDHSEVYRGAIRYDVAIDSWRNELRAAISSVRESRAR